MDFSSVNYSNIQTAVSCIKSLGQFSYCAKTDIEQAFRIVPIHPKHHHLFGFVWNEKFYYDKNLEMGLSESCRIFEELSCALEWAARHKLGLTEIVHVLDDFLFVEKTELGCDKSLKAFIEMCTFIGVPIASEKTFGPAQNMIFLGIMLDTILMETRLPLEKLERCSELLNSLKMRKKTTLRELQSVIGTLQFASSVVVPGRPFLRRLIDLTKGISRLDFKIRLTRAARADIEMWETFLKSFNGRSFFLEDRLLSNYDINLFTDSSTSCGFGAVFGDKWFY